MNPNSRSLLLSLLFVASISAQDRLLLQEISPDQTKALSDLRSELGIPEPLKLTPTSSELWSVAADKESSFRDAVANLGIRVSPIAGDYRSPYHVAPDNEESFSPRQKRILDTIRKVEQPKSLLIVRLQPHELVNYLFANGFGPEADFNQTQSFRVQLTETDTVTLVRKSLTSSAGSLVLRAMAAQPNDAELSDDALFIFENQALAGSMRIGSRYFEVRSIGDGLHVVLEENTARRPANGCAYEPPAEDGRLAAGDDFPPANPDQVSEVDIIVGYTDAAADHYGDIGQFVRLSFELANGALDNTKITNLKFRHSDTYRMDYDETTATSFRRHTDRFAKLGDNFMDDIHQKRDSRAADLCVLLVSDYSWNGDAISYCPSPKAAFAVVSVSINTRRCIFAHEVAHLFGAGHEKRRLDACIEYAHAYINPIGRWGTIMYSGRENWDIEPCWSNLTVPARGIAIGTPDEEDNARALRSYAHLVSAYK